MHPESENPHLIDTISTANLASPVQKTRATMSVESSERPESNVVSPYSQDIASSPSFGNSEDSVPTLNLSGSPSPVSRRLSLLSNASIGDSVPATPTSYLIEDARVDNDLSGSPKYRRIHSTPYPKPRLPLQLTPHPQARVVSLPEWTRNRDPFLEAMRNLRSVSSPARFKRPPLSPLSAEEESIEFSGSSQSAVSAVSFPALPEQQSIGRSFLSGQASSLSVPRDQFYTAPEGFFLTPPSFKSMALSPITTGPERSLPQDRALPPIREDDSVCSVEPNSEDEVSLMLQRATLDASSVYNRSSVSFSNTSRSSSPESVVFLSSISKIPRSFLGGRMESQTIPEVSSIQESGDDDVRHDSATYDNDEHLQGDLSIERHPERPLLDSHEQSIDERATAQENLELGVNKVKELTTPIATLSDVRHDPDWILFDPPRPIPALHGPPSLPYARCPSGAEGVVLDDQQELNGVIWGLSEKDEPRHLVESGHVETSSTQQFVLVTRDTRPLRTVMREKKQDEPTAASEERSSTGVHNPHSLSTVREHALGCSPNSKEKHVRFVEHINQGSLQTQGRRALAPNTHLIPTSGASKHNPSVDLTRILLDQVEKARTNESKPPQQAMAPASRKEILDQLRRFGVPFRPHGLPTPPSTVSPKFASQFPPSDPFLASSKATQHANPRPLTAAYEPPSLRTFAQAATQVKTTTSLKPQDSDMLIPGTSSVPNSLSNIKSIPLLKLRQRQYAEMDSWRTDERPSGEPVLSSNVARSEVVRKMNQPAVSTTKTLQPISVPSKADSTSASNSAPDRTTVNPNRASSSNNRRQHRANKRVLQEASSAQSGSPSKENLRDSGPKNGTDGRKTSRQTGRKRNQRTRTDSSPQNASHT